MKKLLILGAGGHGHVVAEVAIACGYDISYLDDQLNDKVIGKIDDFNKYIDSYDEFFVGIGNNYIRESLTNRLKELPV